MLLQFHNCQMQLTLNQQLHAFLTDFSTKHKIKFLKIKMLKKTLLAPSKITVNAILIFKKFQFKKEINFLQGGAEDTSHHHIYT